MKTKLLLIITMLFSLSITTNATTSANDSIGNIIDVEELPVATPYFLQHQFLSVVATMVVEKNDDVFETPVFLNTLNAAINGFKSPFTDDEILVDKIVVDGKNIYVWRFPEPEYLREALYMAFIPVNGCYMAFAISIGQLVDWEISTSDEYTRHTFGRVKKPENAQECVDLLIERGALTGIITPGDFLQEGYKGPQYRQSRR